MNDTIGDLELYSTEELIAEIVERQTFQGVIVHAEGDCKNHAWRGAKNFKAHWNNNLERQEAIKILEQMSHAL